MDKFEMIITVLVIISVLMAGCAVLEYQKAQTKDLCWTCLKNPEQNFTWDFIIICEEYIKSDVCQEVYKEGKNVAAGSHRFP